MLKDSEWVYDVDRYNYPTEQSAFDYFKKVSNLYDESFSYVLIPNEDGEIVPVWDIYHVI